MPPLRRQRPRRPFVTPEASPLRRSVERRSAVFLVFLRGLPRAVPPLIVAGLVAGGLLATSLVIVAVCLAVVLALFGWLLFLSWPALPTGARVVRIGVLAFMVLGIAVKLSG